MTRARDVANVLSTATALATDTETAAAISSHNSATTSVHGITNTSALATQTYADSAVSTHASAADPHTGYLKESEFNSAGKNYFINGAMEFWQRGTSFTTPGGAYTADRWKATVNGAGTYVVSRQAAGLDGFQYCMRFQRSSGQTYTSGSFIGYAWETEAMIGLQGKAVTYSFYARKGSDFSSNSPSSGINVQLMQGTGSGTHAFSSLTNEAVVLTGNATLTTSWQRFSFTGTISSTSTELRTNIAHSPNGTAGSNDYFEITGFQLEVGSTATSFSRAGGSIANELALCQRYYEQSFSSGTAPSQGAFATVNGVASAYSASDMRTQRFDFKVTKRAVPTMTYYRSNDTATDSRWVYYVNGWTTPTGTSNGLVTADSFNVYMTSSSAFTTRDCYIVEGGGWTASAEL
jgi:hypothetical protein